MYTVLVVLAICWPIVVGLIWLALVIWKHRIRLRRFARIALWMVIHGDPTSSDLRNWWTAPTPIPRARYRR